MDLLDKIQCLPFNLSIQIGRIDWGWMEITLVSNYAFKNYDVSYLCDPINDLLEKFVLLCDNQPFQINPFRSRLNIAVIDHDCESKNMIWLLRKSNDDFYIYIWENNFDMEDLLFANFSSEYFIKNFEEIPNMTQNLIFSMKGKEIDFAKTLLQTLDNLKERAKNLEEKEEEWGYTFSQSGYDRLKTIFSIPR